jgi:dolichyl-phosphate-mannose-protein mannosyltransferase
VRREFHDLTGDYTRFLIGEFAGGRHSPIILPIRVNPAGAISLVALIVLCTVAAVLMRRIVGSTGQDLLPELVVYGSAALVIPAQWIAIILWPDGRGYLTSTVWLLATVAAVALLLPIALRRAPPRMAAPARIGGGWAIAFLAISIVFAGVCGIFALSRIRGIDSYTYHLPRAASWLHHSRLTTNVEDSVFFFFPGNGELFVRWIVGVSDRLAFLSAFGATGLAIYVLYKICREVEQPREIAAIAALCGVSCVVLSFVSVSAYVDSFLALQLLLAVLFLLRWIKNESSGRRTIVPMGLAVGIALGTKYAAIPPALIILAVWLFRVARKNMNVYAGCLRMIDYRTVGRAALPIAITASAPSIYWYLRNLVEHGNPLYPAAILGMRGMPMRVMIATSPALSDRLQWLLYPWHEAGYISLEDALGAVFAGVAVIGLVLAPVQFKQRPIATLWWITVASLALWLFTGNVVLRYGLFPILLTYTFVGELWIAYGSVPVRLITLAAFGLTIVLFGASYAVQTIYTAIAGQPSYGVPAEINRLPPGRVFNAISHDANYGCMGSDYRHDVISVYFNPTPNDLRRFHPDYVLLRESQVAAFSSAAVLQPVGRSHRGAIETSLWRVVAVR